MTTDNRKIAASPRELIAVRRSIPERKEGGIYMGCPKTPALRREMTVVT